MPDISLDFNVLSKILDLMEYHFGDKSEIVLHDLSGSYESTIVDIRNGHITHRKIGNCGSNLGLEVIRGTIKNGDKFNYITHTRDGKILRSSTIYFYNNDGKVSTALCINTDISDSLKLESYLHDINQYEIEDDQQVEEVFPNNVSDLLEHLVHEAISIIDKPISEMKKQDKMQILEYLDRKGAFLITKSGDRICEVLSISRFTLYNYLDLLRNRSSNQKENNDVNG